MSAHHKQHGTVANPSDADIVACLLHIQQELGYPVRQIVNTRVSSQGRVYLVTTLQLIHVQEGKAWVIK